MANEELAGLGIIIASINYAGKEVKHPINHQKSHSLADNLSSRIGIENKTNRATENKVHRTDSQATMSEIMTDIMDFHCSMSTEEPANR